MVETHDHFTKRLGMLRRKHSKMTHGYTTKVGKDGLLVVKPKRRTFGGGGLIKFLLLIAIGFIGFKTFTLVAVGPITYNERLAKLENGTVIEQAGAKALKIDPVTEALADGMGSALRKQ